MSTEFTHPRLGEEVRSISGYYVPCEEHTLIHDQREILYVVGRACIDSSCCGNASWGYIQVPGFLIRKHVRGGQTTPPVSEVEPIKDPRQRDIVCERLLKDNPGAHIEMW